MELFKKKAKKNIGRPKKEPELVDADNYESEPINTNTTVENDATDELTEVPMPEPTKEIETYSEQELTSIYNNLANSENLTLYLKVLEGEKEYQLIKKIEKKISK